MARSIIENGHPIGTRYDEIELRAHNIDTILGSIINTIEEAYMNTEKERESPFPPPITFGTQNVDDPHDSQLLNKCENSLELN